MSFWKNLNKDKAEGSFSNVDPNSGVKKRQQVIGIGIVAATLVVGLFVAHQSNVNSQSSQDNLVSVSSNQNGVVTKNYDGLSVKKDDREIWMTTGIEQIKRLKQQQEELHQKIAEKDQETAKAIKDTQKTSLDEVGTLKSQLKDMQKEIAELKKKKDVSPIVVEPKKESISKNLSPSFSGQNNAPNLGPKPIVVKNRFFNPEQGKNPYNRYVAGLPKPSVAPKVATKLKTVSLVDDSKSLQKDLPKKVKKDAFKHVDDYTPASTFFRAVILGGVDAPTGGQAQDHPYPMLLMVDGMSMLPNKYRYNMKQCNLLVSAYGDLSSDRAIGRLEKISCIDKKGRVYERKVNGYLNGEDGKAGVKGRLVSKQKDVLLNALVAGIGSGIGSAFKQQSMSYSTSALGSVATIDPEKIGVAGLGTGVSKALDRLSQYYIDLAEKLFPVIEVDAGRVVDVVLTSGIDWAHEDDEQSGSTVQAATQNASTIVTQALSMAPTNAPKNQSTLNDQN